LPDLLLALNDCYDAMQGKHIEVNGNRFFAVSGSDLRRNYFRRAGIAGMAERTLQTNYTRTMRQLKSSQLVDTYRFDNGEEFIWRVDEIGMRRNATN
jgi:hypothetical protein